jgi:alanine racemase
LDPVLQAVMVLTCSKEIPIELIVSHFKTLEAKIEELRKKQFAEFEGEIVDLQMIADPRNVSLRY